MLKGLRKRSLLGFRLHPSILPRVRYPILSQLVLFLLSHIRLYRLWLTTSFFACSLLCIVISTFARFYMSEKGAIPVLALKTILLVVPEHLGIFHAVVTCTYSSCLTKFAFPTHTPPDPVYSSLGVIAFIKIHILILLIVSRCESATTAGSHSSCLHVCFTLSYYFLYVCIPRAIFRRHPKSSKPRSLRQGTRILVYDR